MDEIGSYFLPDGDPSSPLAAGRVRTTSMRPSFPRNDPPSTARGEAPQRLTRRSSTSNMRNSRPEPRQPEILAPTPRRHLIESHASQHWLRTPPMSPVSSRGVSPVSQTFNDNTHAHWNRTHSKSFSSLLELENLNASTSTLVPASARPKHQEKADAETAMGRRWIRWMHKRGIKGWVVPGAILASTWIKYCIGLGSYSGQGTPPMFGDYEAQRHWMELTIHLPVRQWYTYDLMYWGLDYPPLTAYISWVCGVIGSWIEPSWFALGKSRGIETEGSKTFIRSTVVVLDALVYVPALVMFVRTWHGSRSRRTQNLALLTMLLQPALLLIDFGHFQYNSVMLGLTLLAMDFFATGRDLLGAICFVLSLGFKQMALYYAPAIGSYLLGKCLYLGPSQGGQLFAHLALVTSLTFLVLFIPFLPPLASVTAILDPISRIFPFNRGLFEDKVANFWCASNVVFKWNNRVSRGALVQLSTGLTALGFLPSVVVLLKASLNTQIKSASPPSRPRHTPILPLLPYALLTSSMSFFLFSFQVHEKTILLPLMPITLMLSGASLDSAVFAWGVLVNNVAVFSMWPLLKRDGLGVQYIATLLLWNRLIGYNPFRLPQRSFIQLLSILVYTASFSLHVLEFFITPPARYPDIFPVLNVLISTPVFVLAWLWSIKCGVEVGWALGPVSRSSGGNGEANVQSRVVGGIDRHSGVRAVSMGLMQGRRRAPFTSGGSSVGADSQRE